MGHLSVVLITIIAVEMSFRLPLANLVTQLISVSRKARHVISSRAISDHWKEKVLVAYAGGMAWATLKIAAVMAAIGATVVVLSVFCDRVFSLDTPTLETFASSTTLGLSLLISVAYVFGRTRLAK